MLILYINIRKEIQKKKKHNKKKEKRISTQAGFEPALYTMANKYYFVHVVLKEPPFIHESLKEKRISTHAGFEPGSHQTLFKYLNI